MEDRKYRFLKRLKKEYEFYSYSRIFDIMKKELEDLGYKFPDPSTIRVYEYEDLF